MNLYPYFPPGAHRDIFGALTSNSPLVLSGVGNISAKGYFVGDLLNHQESRNVFWIANDNRDIYELRNNLPFWADKPIVALDNLLAENQDDYRVTEMIAGIHYGGGKIYLLNHKDIHLPMPAYAEIAESGVMVTVGQEMRTVEFFNKLIQMGYRPSADVSLKK
ncbi:hypothetical protein JXA05_01910, partial [Candidatus Peregrinibacteria bacterium]|nr:hypothetical protein [Candidatus Peregrinibacteria bacterium]